MLQTIIIVYLLFQLTGFCLLSILNNEHWWELELALEWFASLFSAEVFARLAYRAVKLVFDLLVLVVLALVGSSCAEAETETRTVRRRFRRRARDGRWRETVVITVDRVCSSFDAPVKLTTGTSFAEDSVPVPSISDERNRMGSAPTEVFLSDRSDEEVKEDTHSVSSSDGTEASPITPINVPSHANLVIADNTMEEISKSDIKSAPTDLESEIEALSVEFGSTNFFAKEKDVENLASHVAVAEGDAVQPTHQLEVDTKPLLYDIPDAIPNVEEEKPDRDYDDDDSESDISIQPTRDGKSIPLDTQSEPSLEALAKAEGKIQGAGTEPTGSTQAAQRFTASSVSPIAGASMATLTLGSSVTAQTLGDTLSADAAEMTDHEDCTCSQILVATYNSQDIPFTFAWLSARREPPRDLDIDDGRKLTISFTTPSTSSPGASTDVNIRVVQPLGTKARNIEVNDACPVVPERAISDNFTPTSFATGEATSPSPKRRQRVEEDGELQIEPQIQKLPNTSEEKHDYAIREASGPRGVPDLDTIVRWKPRRDISLARRSYGTTPYSLAAKRRTDAANHPESSGAERSNWRSAF